MIMVPIHALKRMVEGRVSNLHEKEWRKVLSNMLRKKGEREEGDEDGIDNGGYRDHDGVILFTTMATSVVIIMSIQDG